MRLIEPAVPKISMEGREGPRQPELAYKGEKVSSRDQSRPCGRDSSDECFLGVFHAIQYCISDFRGEGPMGWTHACAAYKSQPYLLYAYEPDCSCHVKNHAIAVAGLQQGDKSTHGLSIIYEEEEEEIHYVHTASKGL